MTELDRWEASSHPTDSSGVPNNDTVFLEEYMTGDGFGDPVIVAVRRSYIEALHRVVALVCRTPVDQPP